MRLERKDTWIETHYESNDIYGYKGFCPGLICRHKHYAVGKVFEESGASQCCSAGVMHYCKHPYDVFDWYQPYIIENGISEYALVKPLGDICCGERKYATNKLEIVKKLSLREMLEIGSLIPRTIYKPIEFSFEDGWSSKVDNYSRGMVVVGGSKNSIECGSGTHGAVYYFGSDGKAVIDSNMASVFLIGDGINLRLEGAFNVVYVAGRDCSVKIDGNCNSVCLDKDNLNPTIDISGGEDNILQYMY